MGRNSSRIASRRIQNTSREGNCEIRKLVYLLTNYGLLNILFLPLAEGSSASLNIGAASDDDADDDWIIDRKKRKRDKNSPRRSKKVNVSGKYSKI